MVTIKEMAQELGVSTTTVSNVIHGKTKEVSPANIERIQKILKKYDYTPNINARNLASKRSKIIGLLIKSKQNKIANRFEDPFIGRILGAIERHVRQKGYYLMVYAVDDVHQVQQFTMSWNMDGLITSGFVEGDIRYLKERFKNPIASIDDYDTNGLGNCVNIRIEDEQAEYLLTKYVISCGHRKLAFLADNLVNLDKIRFQGFCRALKEANIPVSREENFIQIYASDAGEPQNMDEIYEKSFSYTALLCASDYYAVYIENMLLDRGRKIPEEISIAGFDDVPISRIVRPALTTVRQDIQAKGIAAVEELLKLIEGESEDKIVQLGTELVIRDSVKKI